MKGGNPFLKQLHAVPAAGVLAVTTVPAETRVVLIDGGGAPGVVDTLTGGVAGDRVSLQIATAADTMTIVPTGNIRTDQMRTVSLASVRDRLVLEFDGVNWLEVGKTLLAETPITADLNGGTSIFGGPKICRVTNGLAGAGTVTTVTGGATGKRTRLCGTTNKVITVGSGQGANQVRCPDNTQIVLLDEKDWLLIEFNGVYWQVIEYDVTHAQYSPLQLRARYRRVTAAADFVGVVVATVQLNIGAALPVGAVVKDCFLDVRVAAVTGDAANTNQLTASIGLNGDTDCYRASPAATWLMAAGVGTVAGRYYGNYNVAAPPNAWQDGSGAQAVILFTSSHSAAGVPEMQDITDGTFDAYLLYTMMPNLP